MKLFTIVSNFVLIVTYFIITSGIALSRLDESISSSETFDAMFWSYCFLFIFNTILLLHFYYLTKLKSKNINNTSILAIAIIEIILAQFILPQLICISPFVFIYIVTSHIFIGRKSNSHSEKKSLRELRLIKLFIEISNFILILSAFITSTGSIMYILFEAIDDFGLNSKFWFYTILLVLNIGLFVYSYYLTKKKNKNINDALIFFIGVFEIILVQIIIPSFITISLLTFIYLFTSHVFLDRTKITRG